MTWSLEVRNGDLTVGGAQLGTVTAENKLVQDLRHYLLERMGTDNLHPAYGSLLDGGVTPDGKTHDGVIGSSFFQEASLFVESEIRRICNAYQSRQIERAKEDRMRYNKTTFTAGELLISVDRIDLTQSETTLQARIVLTTGTNQRVALTVPLNQTIFQGAS